jgi:hypothetical protein
VVLDRRPLDAHDVVFRLLYPVRDVVREALRGVAQSRLGLALVDRVAPVHLANERALLLALEEPERRELAELLRKLLRALEHDQPLPPRSGRGGRRRSQMRRARARGRP